MRIVGGKLAGRALTSPNDFRVRPTAEIVRARWMELLAADLPNARVLDLFAGTGALGLEALSRGALSADFVETRPSSLHALRANIAVLRYRERGIRLEVSPACGAWRWASEGGDEGVCQRDEVRRYWHHRPAW